MPLSILYEDNHLIAVEKPCGVPTQADKSGDPDLLNLVKEYIKTRDGKPGNVYLGMVHRLDRPVSGVVVFAKTSKAAARLSAQIRDGRFRKVYLAIVHGIPSPPEGTLEHWLVKDNRHNFVSTCSPRAPNAKKAVLVYRTLAAYREMSLLAIDLVTGRPHQIRVQLAAEGHPVVGDEKYGGKSGAPVSMLALYAVEVSFEHPVRGEKLTIHAPSPSGEPWESLLRKRVLPCPLIS